MKTTTLTLSVTYKGSTSLGLEIETGGDLESEILTFCNDEAGFNNTDDFEEITSIDEVEYEITSWGDVDDFENLQNLLILDEVANDSELENYDWDVISAAIDCDVQVCDIAECYRGKYEDDEDFAREIAGDIGAIDDNARWPNNCIDWERAARELMWDYASSDGYYFRNI